MVDNFRRVNGLGTAAKLYRCASLDGLVHRKHWKHSNDDSCLEDPSTCESVRIVLHEAGFVLDLRSPRERHETNARAWMSSAPGGPLECYESFAKMAHAFDNYDDGDDTTSLRQLPPQRSSLWLNVLSRERFREYILQHWMPGAGASNHQSEPPAVMKVALQRGLLGLNQAILEAGKEQICQALQAITLYWERFPSGVVVVHCVQGKDRTGVLIMLLRSIFGTCDKEIIADYHRSDPSQRTLTSSNYVVSQTHRRSMPLVANNWTTTFTDAPRHVMKATLAWIRDRYGSISLYLDDIGFHSSWRHRLIQATNGAITNTTSTTHHGKLNRSKL